MHLADWSPAHKIRFLERQLETRNKIAERREAQLAEHTRALAKAHAALKAVIETLGKPRREEWLSDAAFEHAKAVHQQVLDAIALIVSPHATKESENGHG